MRKKLSLLSCLLLACACVSAKSLLFTLKDGTQVYYLLGGEKNPIMTFHNGQTTINDDSYTISDIVKFVISDTDDPNNITETHIPSASLKGNCFMVNQASGEVKVYNLSGMEVKARVEKVNDCLSIDLSSLPKNTYIIKVGEQSFKVQKR